MEISWDEVADRVWTTVTQPDDANVVCIAGDERAMLVDAGGTPEVGAALLASARALVGVPLEHVVITHHHHDHWHGLSGMDGVESIAHENILDDDTPEELRPSRTFSLALPLNLGNRFIEVIHFGPGHTRSDIVVVAQDPGVIVTGDLLESAGDPQFDETTSFSDWVGALDALIGASRNDTIFVPGHGDTRDREFAFLQAGDMAILHSTVENLIRGGVRLESAYDAAEEWPFEEATVRAALPLIYAELEAEGVAPRTQLPLTSI